MGETKEKLYWFESYVEQTLTFTSWRKIEAKMCQALKQNLEKKLMDPVNRQLLFQILGGDFVSKYFPSYTNSPAVLDNVRAEEREKKMQEMNNLVASVIENALQKKGPKSDNKIPSDLTAFSKDVQELIDTDGPQGKSKKKQKASSPSDKYLFDILSYNPQVIDHLMPKLQKEVVNLTDDLRVVFWPACIASKEKPKNKKNYPKIKDKFANLYMKIKNGDSDVKNEDEIFSDMKKCFANSKSLDPKSSEDNVQSGVDILIMCQMYGKKFVPQYSHYSAIIEQVFLKNRKRNRDDDFVVAAILLEKVLRLGILNTETANKITNWVIRTISDADKELVAHINEKLFHHATSVSQPLDSAQNVKQNIGKQNSINNLINDWILHAFVKVLRQNSLVFIWDQLFLNKWENSIFHDICVAIIGLLKPWIMIAKHSTEIQKVFTEEPSYLYLMDIRSALGHIQKKGKFSEIPAMNRNIKYEKKQPPIPPPAPPPKVATPPPPPKLPPPVPKFIPWVPYNKEILKSQNLVRPRVDLPFDLYIDGVRFVPDNATIIKISGKVLNMYLNNKGKSIKFQAHPELDSRWRYPIFKFKQTINHESMPMNPDVVVMLRIYTIEKHSKKCYILGSCLFGPFSNKHGKQATLRVGGHQIRVRHGIPDPDFTIEHMLASHMDDNPVIPGLTVLLRVLPNDKETIPAPEYETNYYRSELSKPNESENRLYQHYQKSQFSKSLRDIASALCGQASTNNEALMQLVEQQFRGEGAEVEDFPYQRYVDYDKECGMMLFADKASGLPLILEGRYLQCLVQVFPGEDTKIRNGKSQVTSFVTEELDLDSPQRAPDWSDQPKKVKPGYDDKAFVFASMYGVRPHFDPKSNQIVNKEGKEIKFMLQHAIAWGVINCFEKGAVHAGIHHIPLLKGRPPTDLIEKLGYLPFEYILKKYKNEIKLFETASIEISIWDGHFTSNECPPLPTHTMQLNASPNPERYIRAAEKRSGSTAADLLRSALPNPAEFQIYKSRIIEQLKALFAENLNKSLTNAGYSAMI